MTLIAGEKFGPYGILGLVGEGGMGAVYRARDTKLDRLVAIKILPDLFAQDPERLARFEREAKLLAALNHPNIAIIHGFEDANGMFSRSSSRKSPRGTHSPPRASNKMFSVPPCPHPSARGKRSKFSGSKRTVIE